MPKFRVESTERVIRWATVEAADESDAIEAFLNLPRELVEEDGESDTFDVTEVF